MSAPAQVEELSRWQQLHPKHFFLDTWKRMDAEAHEARKARAAQGLGWDYRPLVALLSGVVGLILMEYWGMDGGFNRSIEWLGGHMAGGQDWLFGLRASHYFRLMHNAWWAVWRVIGFLLIPVLMVKLTRQKVRAQGLSTKDFWKHAWIYLLALSVVLVAVAIVSFEDTFQRYYPFYSESGRSWSDLIFWELFYAAQFFSLEYFFRGYLLTQLRDSMGSHAIFAMVVPYVMIHFGKPMPETFAAILAGVFLGTLAMKTRSIWAGFLIHVSVAVSMDVAALLQTGGLPHVLWPVFS
ncbi:MAG: CPBP family intramembrane metalloprotease [Deltaproteobacteria bacterium]|nr:CPBP family intramembrane metalloprotease [Deltaproteobacteria bacterium]